MSDEQRTPVIAPPKPKKKNKGWTISPAKRAEMERAWVEGRFATVRDLAVHFGVPGDEANIKAHFTRKKLRRGQAVEDYNRRVQEELDKKAAEDARVLAERINETREEHYKMAAGLAKLTWAEILKAKQDNAPFSAVRSNLQSLESAMKVLKMAREERFAVLGLDKEDSGDEEDGLPELVINELTPEQIAEMRARDTGGDDDEDDDVVNLAGDLPDLDDAADDPEDLVDGAGE